MYQRKSIICTTLLHAIEKMDSSAFYCWSNLKPNLYCILCLLVDIYGMFKDKISIVFI